MCENCTKHGEGKKWFLAVKNYSEDLLTDLRRTKYVKDFFAGQARLVGRREPMEQLRRLPGPVRRMVRAAVGRHLALNHYGQVVSLAEVQEMLGLAGGVVRLPCVCRRISTRQEKRCCFGFTAHPESLGAAGLVDASYWQGPDGAGLERLTPAEALTLITDLDREGLVHTVWTFKTPFIGSVCNCSAQECRAMLASLTYDLPALHAGEGVVALDRSACLSCGACAGRCQFGALRYERDRRWVELDRGKCYGCGLCVSTCPAGALRLVSRDAVKAAQAHE